MNADVAGLDDDVFIALTHAGGVRSHLWGSWRQNAPGPRLTATAVFIASGLLLLVLGVAL